MAVYWDRENYEYYSTEKIGNQTLRMGLSQDECDSDCPKTLYFNIYLTLYSKRKHATQNEAEKKITGKNPMATFMVARRMFDELEAECIGGFCPDFDVVLYCTWVDNRRRDAYWKVLSKKGYQWGNIYGQKCIMKKFKRGEVYDFV
jgi:hypothetical protein